MQGGQQNSYDLPPTIQMNLGFALVSDMGQVLSPGLVRALCDERRPLNFADAVMRPLASMSASVYLPPGVRYSCFSSSPVSATGMPSSWAGLADVKLRRKRSPPIVMANVTTTVLPCSALGSRPTNCDVLPSASP